MTRTLLAALWMVPMFAVLLLIGFWFIHPLITSIIGFYRWRFRRLKRRTQRQMVTFDPATRRYTYRRPPKP